MSLSSGRRLRSARLEPNRAARVSLRTHYAALTTTDDHDDETKETKELEEDLTTNEVM